jgi:sugar-specific transcriptional regulator TrmB
MNKNLDKKIFSNLEKLGLSSKESEVYLYLMARDGEVGTSKIIQSTGLHGQYVYTALDSLERMGLVKHVIKNGRKKWSGTPPSRIESLVDEKRIIANQVKDSLELLFKKSSGQEFEVFQGEDQFVTHEISMLEEAPENGTIDIIGGDGDKFQELLGEEKRSYNKLGLDKKIMIRFIGTQEQEEYLKQVKVTREYFDFRIMPGFNKSNISTSIHSHAILFQIYGNPVFVFKIKSEEITNGYRTFFNSLWELCKK